MNSIIEKLQKFIKQTDGDKSSHWKKHLETKIIEYLFLYGFWKFLEKTYLKFFYKIF